MVKILGHLKKQYYIKTYKNKPKTHEDPHHYKLWLCWQRQVDHFDLIQVALKDWAPKKKFGTEAAFTICMMKMLKALIIQNIAF